VTTNHQEDTIAAFDYHYARQKHAQAPPVRLVDWLPLLTVAVVAFLVIALNIHV
jgi:hypothetical protein